MRDLIELQGAPRRRWASLARSLPMVAMAPERSLRNGRRSMATFTIGDGGDFPTITAALASGLVVPGDTLALLSGYNTETVWVGIDNLTFSGDASNTGIVLRPSSGIDVMLTGSAPIAVTMPYFGAGSSITGN